MIKRLLYNWNLLIHKLTYYDVKRCNAICVINNKQCKKITDKKHKYCIDHYNIFKQFCNKYHFVDNYNKFKDDISLSILAEVEYNMRIQFQLMFCIESDPEHEQWLNYLRSIIINTLPSTTTNSFNTSTINLDYLNLELNIKKPEIYDNKHIDPKINRYHINLYYFNNELIPRYNSYKSIKSI
ncbi:hypothetical protein [Alphaentomopoxvirus acuprea]|uniref:Uncharacterized protein n=1 Tax=Alphaentomopoxvirus acuprea TaxID=62099 RepID=W6JPJ5_9POXV|nr:hypothetical protein BA82_gp029 [Anomala cuprea entomopoxvirus]BAO49389.1 hypothetical protein [Anomala cuprea entomopoxvirus]